MSGSPQLPQDPSPMPTMGSDDEESFVLLCNSYAPEVDLSFKDLHIEPVQSGPIEEGKELISMELSQLNNSLLPQMPDVTEQMIEDTVPEISITTISSELSPENVQKRVNAVIAENIRLRDIITTNNGAMETQYKRIMEWKEEVYETYQAHKKKFADAKDFIAKLKTEKDILTFELEKSKEIRGLEQAELLKLKADLAEKESLLKSCDTVDSSREKTSQDQGPVYTPEMIEEITRKLDECEKWMESSNGRYSCLAAENSELRQKLWALEDMEETVDELKEEVQEKNDRILMLEEKSVQRERASALDLVQLHDQISKLELQLSNTAHLQEDINNLRKQLMVAQASVTGLQEMNAGLIAELKAEQKKVQELTQLEYIRDEHFALQQQLKAEQRRVQELTQLESLRDGYFALQQQLKAEQKRVQELTQLESIRDEHFALQQQLEVYKADFNSEREAKNKLSEEKEQIINDFLQLQKRNNELNEELAIMRDNGFVLTATELSNQQSSSNTSSAKPQGSPPLSMFTCPVCNLKHRSLKLLEDHVETCIPDPDWF